MPSVAKGSEVGLGSQSQGREGVSKLWHAGRAHAGRAKTRAKKGKWEVEVEGDRTSHCKLHQKSNEPSQYKHAKQDLLGVTVSQPTRCTTVDGNELCRPLVSLVRLIVQ